MTSSGILLLDKPRGLTSNAALGRAKWLMGLRKAGHTGALDPMATGLLPLCFGEATKVSGFLLDADKGYRAEILLGQTTDSGDADGEVTATAAVPELDRAMLETVLDRFRGPIDQIPPMYSALKHNGKRLHELARAGVEVKREPRRVTIHRLDLVELDSPRMTLEVECSKGTYIRSLAMDLGEQLGCGAHLTGLRRFCSGPFSLDQAITLEVLEAMSPDQRRAALLPPDAALLEFPEVRLDDGQAGDIRHGRKVALMQDPVEAVRMYAGDGFLGVGEIGPDGMLRVRRLFRTDL